MNVEETLRRLSMIRYKFNSERLDIEDTKTLEDEYFSLYDSLIERDRMLVEALQYVLENDPRGSHWHIAAKVKDALKAIGEDV